MTHLVQQYINMEGSPIVVHEIPRDREWFQRNKPILEKFVEEMKIYFPFDLILIQYQLDKYERKNIGNLFNMHAISESMWRISKIDGLKIKH